MNRRDEVRRIAALLSDPDQAEHPRTFPANPSTACKPGLYAWFAEARAREIFLRTTGGITVNRLLYVGQTGKTLDKRISGNHMRGSPRNSTLRHTISALLRGPLNLRLDADGKLILEENRRVSAWIKDNLRVTIVPVEDSSSLKCIERTILDMLDPPFNLKLRPSDDLRQRIRELRRAIKR